MDMVSEPPANSNSHPGSKFLLILQVSTLLLPSDEFVYSNGTCSSLPNIYLKYKELLQSPLPVEALRGRARTLCLVSILSPALIIVSGTQRLLIKLLNTFSE